jgi:hypothetical protein
MRENWQLYACSARMAAYKLVGDVRAQEAGQLPGTATRCSGLRGETAL